MGSIVIVDDDTDAQTRLVGYLRERGHRVSTLAHVGELPAALERDEFDVVLADAAMPAAGAAMLLRTALRRHTSPAMVLAATHPTVAEAVAVMRAGAYDYLTKPLSPRRVERMLRRVAALRRSRGADRRPTLMDPQLLLKSKSPQILHLLSTARRAAESDVPVLISGESGTGKRMLAAAIHAWSRRCAAPFIAFGCDSHAEPAAGLLAHLRTSTTRSAHGGGTLFLDVAGAQPIPRALQLELLELLDDHRPGCDGSREARDFDVRIVAASSCDLEAEVRSGRMREDLFFRLSVVRIALPPLRERVEDLLMLRDHFLARLSAHHQRGPLELTPAAAGLLARHPWPGNVPELMSVLERVVVLSHGSSIDADDLAASLRDTSPRAAPVAYTSSLAELEQRHIELALKESATLGEAAARLGIDPATLWRKRKRYGLDRSRGRDDSRSPPEPFEGERRSPKPGMPGDVRNIR